MSAARKPKLPHCPRLRYQNHYSTAEGPIVPISNVGWLERQLNLRLLPLSLIQAELGKSLPHQSGTFFCQFFRVDLAGFCASFSVLERKNGGGTAVQEVIISIRLRPHPSGTYIEVAGARPTKSQISGLPEGGRLNYLEFLLAAFAGFVFLLAAAGFASTVI